MRYSFASLTSIEHACPSACNIRKKDFRSFSSVRLQKIYRDVHIPLLQCPQQFLFLSFSTTSSCSYNIEQVESMTRQPSKSTLHTRHFACKLASPHFQVFFFPTFVSFPIFSLYIELLYLSFFFIHSKQRARERKRESYSDGETSYTASSPSSHPFHPLSLLLPI